MPISNKMCLQSQKKHNKERTEEHSETFKWVTKFITKLIYENALLNNEICIKGNNIV